MSVQTLDQRLADLLRLCAQVEAEIARVDAAIHGRSRSRRRSVPPCGTERGYQRHRYYGEPVDDDCAEAHRVHNRVQYRKAAS